MSSSSHPVDDASRNSGGANVSETAVDPLRTFLTYPFSTDVVYQQGLASIAASGTFEGKTEEETALLMRRSEVFYFNRITGHSISVDEATQAEHELPIHDDSEVAPMNATEATTSAESCQPASDETASEGHTLSFAELKRLIEEGKTDQIPNNRQIPKEINRAPPSQSTANMRRKPWEVNE